MPRPYLDLRYCLAKKDQDMSSTAKCLGISKESLSRKMNLHTHWTLGEAYQLCLLSGHSLEELPKLFPLEDIAKSENKLISKSAYNRK